MAEKYWYGGTVGREGDWSWGGVDPFNLDAGDFTNVSGLVGLPAAGHKLKAGDSITLAGTNNFDGTHVVNAATTANVIVIPMPFNVLSGTNSLVAGTQWTAGGIDLYASGVQPGMKLKLWDSVGTPIGEFLIISIMDSSHLEIEQTNLSASGLTYAIVRVETFDGTETVTYNGSSNWKLVSDGSNCAKPASGDVVHFNDRAYYIQSTSKYQDCTIGVNASGTGTPNLGGVFVSAGFSGNIGSGSQPLEINCQSNDIVVDGECTMHLKLSAGSDNDASCGRFVVNNERANVYLSSFLNNASYVCLYDLLVCLKGFLWVQDNCAVTEILSANYNSSVDGGIGIEDKKNGTLCSINAVKGDIIWRSKIDQLELFDAKFAWGDSGMSEVTDYSCNLLTIYSKSGEFLWQMADSGQSLIKKMVLYAGNLIASQAVNSGYRKKIGTGTEISELWPDATANLNSSSNNVLIAAGSKLEAHGGTLIASSGSLLSW